MIIEGVWWFVGALLICGMHVLYIRGWRRELRANRAWWVAYDTRATRQHEVLMRHLQGLDVADDQEE